VRVSVLEDLDVGIVKLAWLRRIELAGFTDGGDVKYTIGRVFHSPSGWKWGAGAGVRFELDVLGVRPFLLRFDIAWRCDSGEGPSRGVPQYYLGASQSF
jgi:outer membrane translocation and assembly module TamA